MKFGRSAVLATLIGVASCASPPPRPDPLGLAGRAWQTRVAADHAFVGRVWSVEDATEIGGAQLVEALSGAELVLLGEKHDHADHHRLQAELIRALAGESAGVALEMLRPDQARAAAEHLAVRPGDVDGIADAVAWAESGWPDFALYRPVFAAAAETGAALCGAAPDRATAAHLRSAGLDAFPPERRAQLGLGEPLSAAARTALADEIREAHCGHAPESRIDAMIAVQRARDALMADSLARCPGRLRFLIAGNGHVRRDRAVPVHVPARAVARLAAVALLEVDPADAGSRPDLSALRGVYDYVLFTPRVDLLDPCEKFREQLERMRAPQPSPGPSASPSSSRSSSD